MIWVLVTCWLTGVRALLNSSCPQMLDFCMWFGRRYTWNTAEDHCQILLWGFASGAAFNLYLRVKEEAGQWEAVLRHPAPDGCLEEKHQEPIRVSRTLLSSPPSTWLCTQPGLSHWDGRRSSQRDAAHFPSRQTNLNVWFCPGSHALLAKEIKAYLFLA